MSTSYRIAEAAERSGFSAPTLRYYEDLGLLSPGRTDAGYRLYDDTSLDRLRFIARAKQLGCTLDEIRDLAAAWDAGECAPLQDRLRGTVAAKLAETRERIADLTAFAADLQRAASTLGGHRPDGPCDDACGCTPDLSPPTTADPPTAVSSTGGPTLPPVQEAGRTPVACTLGADEVADRVDDWHHVLEGVTARHALTDGIRLDLGPDADVTEIARLAAAEQGCCRFLGFALTVDGRGIGLEVHAPPDAPDVVTALFGDAR